MENRKMAMIYKNIEIHYYRGSNYYYIGSRIFNSLLSAKRFITRKKGLTGF